MKSGLCILDLFLWMSKKGRPIGEYDGVRLTTLIQLISILTQTKRTTSTWNQIDIAQSIQHVANMPEGIRTILRTCVCGHFGLNPKC